MVKLEHDTVACNTVVHVSRDRLQPFGILQVNILNSESYSGLQAITVAIRIYIINNIQIYLNATHN